MKILTNVQIQEVSEHLAAIKAISARNEVHFVNLLQAQAELTQAETLKRVGEWLERRPTAGNTDWHVVQTSPINRLKSGRKPWEEKNG